MKQAAFSSVSAILLAATVMVFTGCTTLANRRDLWSPQPVDGPYTRMVREGLPKPTGTTGSTSGEVSSGKNVVR